jgi:hypothetical protein
MPTGWVLKNVIPANENSMTSAMYRAATGISQAKLLHSPQSACLTETRSCDNKENRCARLKTGAVLIRQMIYENLCVKNHKRGDV